MKILCKEISGETCKYTLPNLTHGQVLEYLKHFNEIHDPEFLPRCEDDLLVEYNDYIEKIQKIRFQ